MQTFPSWLLFIGNTALIVLGTALAYLLCCLIRNVLNRFEPQHVLGGIILVLFTIVILCSAGMLTNYELHYSSWAVKP